MLSDAVCVGAGDGQILVAGGGAHRVLGVHPVRRPLRVLSYKKHVLS